MFEKLREAALAYQLTRKWSKEKILTEYLNSIYFGNGAYGIESAARTYFGNYATTRAAAAAATRDAARRSSPRRGGAARRAWSPRPSGLRPARAPATRQAPAQPRAARHAPAGLHHATELRAVPSTQAIPTAARTSSRRAEDSEAPYFTTGCASRSSTATAPARAFGGGLKITTTLDLELQQAAEQADLRERLDRDRARAPRSWRSTTSTGEVRAMVGGRRLRHEHAVQPGHPGPAPARLVVQALHAGRGAQGGHLARTRPGRPSRRSSRVPNTRGKELLRRQQLRRLLLGHRARWPARPTYSDNSVFAEVGHQGRARKKHRRLAQRMGIRTPVSTQPRDDARRPQAGRHAAGHGPRLRDARRTAASGSRARWARPTRAGRDHAGRRPPTARADREQPAPTSERASCPHERRPTRRPRSSRPSSAAARQARADRRLRRRQDRHDRELRRRLVRGLRRRATRWPCGSATRTSSSR